MQAHLVQMDIRWEDRAANHARAAGLLAQAAVEPGDLIVLPEMFDTAFSFNIERTADATGETARFLADLAGRSRATVVGGTTAIGPDARGRNRALVYSAAGAEIARYDKIHPFTFGREGERFTGGAAVTTFDWRAGEHAAAPCLRVCPVICYDLRFPELFRRGLDMGAQAFAVIANWPAERAAHWRALAVARAIENQAFVFAVNRVGADPALRYAGGSLVIGPKGEVLAEGDDAERVVTAAVKPEAVSAWRSSFKAWQDRKAWL